MFPQTFLQDIKNELVLAIERILTNFLVLHKKI